MSKRKTKILLFLILGIAIFFRFWNISDSPPGLYPDEAVNGNDALKTLKNKFQLFYEHNNGREGLFIWLISLSFQLFKPSITTLRLPSIIIGILTTLGLYLFTKELFFKNKNKEKIALLASFLLSVSFWHVNFSRIAFRGILVPFLLTFSFYFLLKAFRENKVGKSILAGIFYGLGFYSYSPFYLSIIILFSILFFYWKNKKNLKRFLKISIANLLTIFLTALPMGILLLTKPEKILNRGAQVSVFKTQSPIMELFKSLFLHLGMFNIFGDQNWRHNIATKPQLSWIVGLFFLIGFFFLIKNLKKNKTKEKIIIIWFFAMLLPGILTSQGCPHALRTIGIVPAVYIISALGFLTTYQKCIKKYNKKIIKKIFLSILVLIVLLQFNNYFINWSNQEETRSAFKNYYVQLGRYLNSLPPSTNKIVISSPVTSETTMFLENIENKKSLYLFPENINQIPEKENTVIVPIDKENNQLFQKLKEKFPKGKIIHQNNITIFKI